jgi:hypothetical protein
MNQPRTLDELSDDLHRRWSRELRKRRPDWQKLARLHNLLAEIEAIEAAFEARQRRKQGKRP